MNKLLVEFEGENADSTATPWYKFQADGFPASDDGTFIPPLGTCRGLSQGFVDLGSQMLGFDDSRFSKTTNATNENEVHVDEPLFLRPNLSHKVWWEHLSGKYSSIHDWSYLFIPHCTPGKEGIASTNVNVQSVSKWVMTQFISEEASLDSLVTVSGGGTLNGDCISDSNAPSAAAHSIWFAIDTTTEKSSGNAMVLLDGSTLQNDITVKDAVQEAMLSKRVNVAWTASNNHDEEESFIQTMKQIYPTSFYIHRPGTANGSDKRSGGLCPRYTFSDVSTNDQFSNFLDTVVKDMSWAKQKDTNTVSTDEGNTLLSFLSIVLIVLGMYTITWIVYLMIKYYRRLQAKKRGNEAVKTLSPHDLWFMALTRLPTLFLFVSVAIPCILSYIAYSRNGNTISVNIDFESYLDIDTKDERTTIQYKSLLEYQRNQYVLKT